MGKFSENTSHTSKDEMSVLPYIIAVDFDGTLVTDEFPEIGEPHPYVFGLVKAAQSKGVKVILWTCRTGKNLEDAVAVCKAQGFTPDEVNENLPEVITCFGGSARKVYANEYWDDKAVVFGGMGDEAAMCPVCAERFKYEGVVPKTCRNLPKEPDESDEPMANSYYHCVNTACSWNKASLCWDAQPCNDRRRI